MRGFMTRIWKTLLILPFLLLLGAGDSPSEHRDEETLRVFPFENPSPIGPASNQHRTGHIDGTVLVPSGHNLQELVPRHYRLFVPTHYDPSRPTPLLINMPGHRVGIYIAADFTQLQRTADMNGFIVAYAEQQWRTQGEMRWAWWTDWNWTTHPNDNPDVTFLRKLVETIQSTHNIDRNRVYASGHSRGGAMSVIAALELPDVFAAVCSQSGFTEFGYDQRMEHYAGRKTPILLIHGVDDPDVNVSRSDRIAEILQRKGWNSQEVVYWRLANVKHRWQPQLNQQMWDFLSSKTLNGGQP